MVSMTETPTERACIAFRSSSEYDLGKRMEGSKPSHEPLTNPVNPNASNLDNRTPAGVRAMELAFQD